MRSLVCAMIDTLALSFQAAAWKPRLAALIGFQWGLWLHLPTLLEGSQRFTVCSEMLNFLLKPLQVPGEHRLSLLMLRRRLITPCVSAGRAVLKKKHGVTHLKKKQKQNIC